MAAAQVFHTLTPPSLYWETEILLEAPSYRAGSLVRFRLNGDAALSTSVDFFVTVWRTGQTQAVATKQKIDRAVGGGNGGVASYVSAWRVPDAAATGLYSLVVEARDRDSGVLLFESKPVEFAVWRSEIAIEAFDSDRRFYGPGDPVTFALRLVNRSAKRWTGLRVEVGESQYPWIAPAHGAAADPSFALAERIELEAGESRQFTISGAISRDAKPGAVHYTATVRMADSSGIVAFKPTPPMFLRTPSRLASPVYPSSYIHTDLSQVRVNGLRALYAPESRYISFDTSRSLFAAHRTARITFVAKPGERFDRARLELRNSTRHLVHQAEAQRSGEHWSAEMRVGPAGLYDLTAKMATRRGKWREAGHLEIAANTLPRSLAIVCAHPDDEFLHPAAIRAAVENWIPVHIIYLTNGDAGGSDRFFGPDYTPAEAIEFGHIRMAEARAAARHLGVPEANLHFLGLPDGFLDEIRTETARAGSIFSPLLGADASPFSGVEQPNLPFRKRNLIRTLMRIFSQIDPDTVYTSHPDERHADHRAASWLTIEALQALVAAGRLTSVPAILTDQFYGAGDREPAAFAYRPHTFLASGEAMARVQEAYWFYQTQGGNHALGNLLSYADLPRTEHHSEIVNWAAASVERIRLHQVNLRATA